MNKIQASAMPQADSHAKADLVLLLVTLLAAAGWIFSKEALNGLAPLLFIGIRFSSAGLLLLVGNGRQLFSKLNKTQFKKSLATAFVMAGALLCWIHGLDQGKHMATGAFITSLGILLVPLLSWAIFSNKIPRSTWISIPVAISGLALLSLQSGLSADPGQLWYLAAAILFALHFTLISHLASGISASVLTGIQLLVVGISAISVSAFIEPWPVSIENEIIGWLLASILLATSLRFTLQTYGQSLAPASHAALIMILEPVWTALAAAFWFSETMTWSQFFGCTLIFSALIVSRWHWVARLLQSLNRLRSIN